MEKNRERVSHSGRPSGLKEKSPPTGGPRGGNATPSTCGPSSWAAGTAGAKPARPDLHGPGRPASGRRRVPPAPELSALPAPGLGSRPASDLPVLRAAPPRGPGVPAPPRALCRVPGALEQALPAALLTPGLRGDLPPARPPNSPGREAGGAAAERARSAGTPYLPSGGRGAAAEEEAGPGPDGGGGHTRPGPAPSARAPATPAGKPGPHGRRCFRGNLPRKCASRKPRRPGAAHAHSAGPRAASCREVPRGGGRAASGAAGPGAPGTGRTAGRSAGRSRAGSLPRRLAFRARDAAPPAPGLAAPRLPLLRGAWWWLPAAASSPGSYPRA